MAKPRSSEETDTQPEPQVPEAEPTVDDVLVYVDRMGPIAPHWNERPQALAGTRALIPSQKRVRLEPGLSFCPGADWPHVRATREWIDRVESGKAKAIAGHEGPLASGWAAIKPKAALAYLDKTYHVPALLRLRKLEGDAQRPRVDVVELIDAKLAEMRHKVEAHQAQRAQHRQGRLRSARTRRD